MTDRPILFNADMIRALLEGRKTQTRRILRPQPVGLDRATLDQFGDWWTEGAEEHTFEVPKYKIGDRLWAREAWSGEYVFRDTPPSKRKPLDTGHGTVAFPKTVHYWADGDPEFGDWERGRPSIHMPRWASRLTLIVTDVRVQRLQDISEGDVYAEGAMHRPTDPRLGSDVSARDNARRAFRTLWNSVYGHFAWGFNPWVSAATFTVHRCNIDQME